MPSGTERVVHPDTMAIAKLAVAILSRTQPLREDVHLVRDVIDRGQLSMGRSLIVRERNALAAIRTWMEHVFSEMEHYYRTKPAPRRLYASVETS